MMDEQIGQSEGRLKLMNKSSVWSYIAVEETHWLKVKERSTTKDIAATLERMLGNEILEMLEHWTGAVLAAPRRQRF